IRSRSLRSSSTKAPAKPGSSASISPVSPASEDPTMSDEPIHKILEDLPSSNLTTRLLGALDYVVPGQWENVTSWETMIKRVTGEEDQEIIQKVGDRAIQLYNDPDQGYH